MFTMSLKWSLMFNGLLLDWGVGCIQGYQIPKYLSKQPGVLTKAQVGSGSGYLICTRR